MSRGFGVYRYLLQAGIPRERLSQEAFGQYHPRFRDISPSGRLMNRRVDIVLDKRNTPEILNIEQAREKPVAPPKSFLFRNFLFELEPSPGNASRSGN